MPRALIRQWTRRFAPVIDRLTSHPAIRRFLPSLGNPGLWHLNRRSTARAVAIGLFCGLIPGPLQIPAAVALCYLLRGTLPLAVITTLYTNPFTIVPLYLVAYEIGRLALRDAGPPAPFVRPPDGGLSTLVPAVGDWMLQLGEPLAVGLVLLASALAALGWVAVRVAWRIHVVRAWRRRAARPRRDERPPSSLRSPPPAGGAGLP